MADTEQADAISELASVVGAILNHAFEKASNEPIPPHLNPLGLSPDKIRKSIDQFLNSAIRKRHITLTDLKE